MKTSIFPTIVLVAVSLFNFGCREQSPVEQRYRSSVPEKIQPGDMVVAYDEKARHGKILIVEDNRQGYAISGRHPINPGSPRSAMTYEAVYAYVESGGYVLIIPKERAHDALRAMMGMAANFQK